MTRWALPTVHDEAPDEPVRYERPDCCRVPAPTDAIVRLPAGLAERVRLRPGARVCGSCLDRFRRLGLLPAHEVAAAHGAPVDLVDRLRARLPERARAPEMIRRRKP